MKTTNSIQKTWFRLLYLPILIATLSLTMKAQMPAAITIDPPEATAYEELTLTFDPALACFQSGSLEDLPSIAMHSGVTFLNGETWQFVITFDGIGANGQMPILMPTGDGRYAITFTPSEFYGFPPFSNVTQICAVFNNGYDWSQDGRDFILNTGSCQDFFIPINYQGNVPQFHFNMNMNKMILEGNFNPSTQHVYVEINGLGVTQLFDEDADGIYDAVITDGVEVDSTYTYQFRINSDQYEDTLREITAVTGTLDINMWWNNDPLATITFVVDMFYQYIQGNFFDGDYVDVAGTMNNWEGSEPMESIGYYLYSITLYAEPGVVEYKFRINGDWDTYEFPDGPNRMTWAIPEPISIYHFYNDYNPNTWPVTFNVDMNEEIDSGRFDPENDYLDVEGSWSGWVGHYVLFDRLWTEDGIYTINMLIDMYDPYIEFKCRINGDWNNSEFPMGGPNRFWTVQDTTGGQVNLFECVYNITDVPYPPYVYDLAIDGELLVGQEISGTYTYYDPNADAEGESLYQWFLSDDSLVGDDDIIAGAIFQNYTISENDLGKYLIFEVTPFAETGEPSEGYPLQIISEMVTIGMYIKGKNNNILQIYPNPATQILNINSKLEMNQVAVYNIVGQELFKADFFSSTKTIIPVSDFETGIYFVKCFYQNGKSETIKFSKF